MSDKSFGDHTNRNIVKNPLLSSAVTGLSLEDLTHKAVLLPVTPSLEQITRSDQQQGSQARTLAHPEHETSTFPSGDAFSAISLSNTPQITNQNLLDSKKNVNLEENRNTQSVTQSKASAKSDDDFDVNEYIARLQGTRYVSAPLHSHLKEGQNPNLEATEENLEEINLNETVPAETQQSLTADIAQNFSQLPTVLPHVASAVFSSFSNMLSYKSREQTPDHQGTSQGNKSGYDDVQFQRPDAGVPLMGVEEYKAPKDVAPPPKEPPIGGTSNFRITTKKKYAQIPGLSSGDAAQTMTYPPIQNIPPIGQNMPPIGQNMSPIGQNMPPIGQNMPPTAQNMPPVDQNIPPMVGQNIPPLVGQNVPPFGQNTHLASYSQDVPHGQNMPPFAQIDSQSAQNVPFTSQNMSNISQNMPPIGHSRPHFVQSTPSVGLNEQNLDSRKVEDIHFETATKEIKMQESNVNVQSAAENPSLYNMFKPATEKLSENRTVELVESQTNLLTDSQNFFTPVEHKKQNIPTNPGGAAIIPPPPMFSNLPRRDSQSSVGKSILPPSVARRISANQPIAKPAVSVASYPQNIFVPGPMPEAKDSGQQENFSSDFSSAFVPTYNSSLKLEPIEPPSNIPLPSQTNVPSNIPLPVDSGTSATYYIPSNETKQSTAKTPTFFTPKETASVPSISFPSLSIPAMATSNLSPAVPLSAFPPDSSYGSTSSSLPATSFASMNMPPAFSALSSGSIDIKPQNLPPPMFQPVPQNVPPTFFNPSQPESSSINVPHPITQMPPMTVPEPPKPVADPPKATGNVNFRMTKKRPQYYAGPIEGVGPISNNVKPVIAPVIPSATPVEASNFQGALFTPEQPTQPAVEQYSAPNIELATVPFDISNPVEQASSHAAFNISKPEEYGYGTSFNMRQSESQNYDQEYNTPFDMSRDSTDHIQPKQESRGFGIIGSLKSKLSAIDINKIQSTVTTFFDPAYNDTKVAEPIGHDNASYQQQQFVQAQPGQNNFEIFVPNVEQNQYSQFSHGFDYSQTSQHHQTQDPYLQNQGQSQNVSSYSTSSYYTDPNYSTEQVYSYNPLYDNTQTSHPAATSYYPQENIPAQVEIVSAETSKTDNTALRDPNAVTQEKTTIPPIQQSSFEINYQQQDHCNTMRMPERNQQNVTYFNFNAKPNLENLTSSHSQLYLDQQKASSVIGSEEASNMTFCNPNAFAQENRQIWEPQHDNFPSFSQPFDQHQENVSTSTSEKQVPLFYNPNAFTVENQQIPKNQQLFESDIQQKVDEHKYFTSDILKSTGEMQKDSQTTCDSALNTSKYNIASIQTHQVQQSIPTNVPPATSFFDNPAPTNLPQYPKDNEADRDNQRISPQKEQFKSKYPDFKILTDMPSPIGGQIQDKLSKADNIRKTEDNKDITYEKEKQVKEGNLIESLSRDDIPVLGVSTVPLFGLSAIIADKSKDVSESEKAFIFNTTYQSKNLFESKTAASFFENKEPENKIISENQVKKISFDIAALSINDVKNVLVIEPPQENIGAMLKRNASSSKLENLPEKRSKQFEQQSDVNASTKLQDGKNIKFDGNTAEIFFRHSDDVAKELEDSQKVVSVDEEHSELNICETCREVSTPEHERKHKEEDLTTQLIENITAPVQLSHPLTVPLKESDAPVVEISPYDSQQLDEITHVAEDTFGTLQVQSATELLYDRTPSEVRDYGWTTEEKVYPIVPHVDYNNANKVDCDAIATKHDYDPELDAVSSNLTHIVEDTFGTLQVQSSTELLDDRTPSEIRDYGWTTEEKVCPIVPHVDHENANKVDSDSIATKHDYGPELDDLSSNLEQGYEFKLDSNAKGFFGNNSLFFDNVPVPTNASDEIKAEIKHSHEDIVLPRQMSIPTAPPQEGDPKMDEPGVLDVHSIEQDAKKDFPLEEEFVIEPSTDEFLSTDDDKLEFRERKKSSEDSTSNDTFTNRIERFKNKIDNPDDAIFERKSFGSPPISMASYFDTGNYAVESHIRNALVAMRIPPGFEEEYARKLSGISLGSADNTTEPYIPETSTQTPPINTPTYSSPNEEKENIIGSEIRRKENTEALAKTFVTTIADATTMQAIVDPAAIAGPSETATVFADMTTEPEKILSQNVQPLADPIHFFSANIEEPKPAEPAASESFNRLASYFALPPAQPEHSKSFFELSQSQNHYRHETKMQDHQKPFFEISQSQNHYIDDDTKNNIKKLMNDLTSPQNIKEHTVKTVNYFTVELDNDIKRNTNTVPINIKIDEININKNIDSENRETKLVDNDSIDKDKKTDCDDIMKCELCLRYIPGVNTKVFIVKTAVNETSEPSSDAEMPSQKDNESEKLGNTVHCADFDVEKQAENNVTVINEHRVGSEYTPVKHHWFYREDVEEKSVWRGFSNTDSTALEEAHQSPDLNENTLVATDGGRYDVNVMGRLRIAVYWKEKPTNVRRCSWFYKGTTDARYVPYTESVAEKLEEEYRHGVTTGEWHRKMVLPNNEMVIMHGPSVMVHFLHSGATDAFTTPPSLLGKRIYRNPPKIRVARDQEPKIDHLILLVHGAGEYKRTRYLDQAASRPRVVRRSHEESEIEDSEPSKIDHLLLLCHGVGSACDMRFRSVEEVVEDFRSTSLQLLQSHYRNSYDNGLVSRVEVLPISWHEQLHSGETGVDKRLARVTLDSIPRLRAFTNHTVLDVLFYTSPVFHQTIIDTVCFELNRVYTMFRERNPHFRGEVSLGGHSLGSVILYDLLCHQAPESPLEVSKSPGEKRYVTGTAGTGQPVNYPQLVFPPAALYALGSPIAIFECIRGVESLGMEFALPTCRNFFNIFHPYDPIAYRIEPLINPQLQEVKPSQIPHHKGRKRMHLELKDTMARVGADLKQKLIESLRTTWNKWKATPPPDGQLEKVVEEEMEKEQLTSEEETPSEVVTSSEMLGRLNSGRRVDYVLQEAPLEMINEYLFAMSSHVGYWESEDTMLLMLREIYDSLGVQPDSTVPQQSMTLQRTKTVPQDETSNLLSETDTPSTSRGGT